MLSNVLVLRRHRCITLLKHESVLELSSFGVMTSSVERFKWNRLAAWERLVAEGFSPEQIVNAYAAPAESYWLRNRDDPADRERGRALRLEPIRPTRSTPTESNPKFAYP